MAHARFVFEEHREFGNQGWLLKGHPTFDPVDARGVAHDLLEHAPNDRGSVLEEISALGAFAFVRIDSGLLFERYSGNRSEAEIIGGDILSVFRDAYYAGDEGPHLREKASRWKLLEHDYYEDVFEKAIRYARDHWASEMDNEDDAAKAALFFEGHGAAVLMSALRKGFRRAERRYGCCSRAATLFRRIEREVKNVTGYAELGDEIVVHYGIESLEVRITHRDAYGYPRH